MKKKANLAVSIFKTFVHFFLGFWKAFFDAVTNVAWGIASIVFMHAGLLYLLEKYEQDTSYIDPLFLSATRFVVDNVVSFVVVFFIIYFLYYIKEGVKK